jgi:hypothetical protein
LKDVTGEVTSSAPQAHVTLSRAHVINRACVSCDSVASTFAPPDTSRHHTTSRPSIDLSLASDFPSSC